MQPQTPQVRRRGSVVFTIAVSVACLVGAAVVGLLLLVSGAPGAVAVGALLAALPVGPLVAAYLWLDRYEPEPRSLLLLGLAWGAFVATALSLLLQSLDQVLLGSSVTRGAVVTAPVTEELTKGLFVLLLVWFRRRELDGVLDGIVYAGMVGIGFAFTENILYLGSAYMGADGAGGGLGSALGLFIVRGIVSPFAHPFFTAFIGIGIGLAVTTRRPVVRVLAPLVGFGLAVLTHALWNGSLLLADGAFALPTYLLVMVPAFLVLTGFAIWSRRRERAMLVRALTDCAHRGFLHPAEIPWLASLTARKVARSHAHRAGGSRARAVMSDYQTEAIELGFLHHRFLRGVAPSGFEAYGQSHVVRMQQLRPHLLWPQPSGRRAGYPVVEAHQERGA